MISLPSRDKAIQLLRESGCSYQIVEHCRRVSKIAVNIAKKFKIKGVPVNIDLVEIGALIHDIGRSKTHKIQHNVKGAEITRSLGLPKEIVQIVERHIGAGIPAKEAIKLDLPPRDFIPITLEEKIVTYADKIILGEKEVSFKEAFLNFKNKHGHDNPAVIRFRQLHEDLQQILGETLNDNSDSS